MRRSALHVLPLLVFATLASCEWGKDRPRGSMVERPTFEGHTHADSPENISPDGMEAVGEVLTELIYRGG